MDIFDGFPLLSLLIFLPFFGAIFVFLIPQTLGKTEKNIKNTALFIAGCTFMFSLLIWGQFDPSLASYQFVENKEWIPGLNIRYFLGIDGISLFFVLLTTSLIPLCILGSWESIKHQQKEFLIFLLVLETFILGAFCVLDLLLFYVFFEGTLIPMFLIIGIWGGERRIYAAFKFFFYTLTGSIFMFIAILFLYFKTGTTSIPDLALYPFESGLQVWLWLAFFASFAIKLPMFPFHTWLPEAHVEAPTVGSMILAGILLKMGGYGFLRISLPFFPEASYRFAPYVCGLSIIGIVYASLVALVQRDIKKLIAYSSIAHMGFVTLGIFTFQQEGLNGSILQMLSHGVLSSGLFLCVGILYERVHSRDIEAYGGIVSFMPLFSVFFMSLVLGAIGLPGTAGFVGEFLVILGTFQVSPLMVVGAGFGIIMSAVYMLGLYRKVVFGPVEKIRFQKLKDLSMREGSILFFFVGCMFWMGLYPNCFIAALHQPISKILEYYGRQQDALVPIFKMKNSIVFNEREL